MSTPCRKQPASTEHIAEKRDDARSKFHLQRVDDTTIGRLLFIRGTKGQRIVVDCAAKGIDSKLKAVLIVANSTGADLQVERRGGAIDFTAPETGTYVVKVHDLTFNGGAAYFYRLALRQAAQGEVVPRLPSIKTVSSFSWPPARLTDDAVLPETEPNNRHAEAMKITLPCDIAGSFFPAADVDTFEFTAKKGEVWWVEVASERLGLSTDPSIVVQRVSGEGANENLSDVVEFSDIPSPIKVSTNGYSYNGPPYNAGSSDIIGKLEIREDGIHRLQLRDLFGGTRSDPRNIYRLIIRKAAPDFALVGWALHMNLRNGDRNALSKPIALRGGATMPIEVVVVRRDGFNGEIQLFMDNLPEGVSAAGLKIPSGQSRGIMLITAEQDAPRGLSSASFSGRATIDGKVVTHPCRLASMQWPVPDASREIPSPRLLADVPVSVGGSEFATITIAAGEKKGLGGNRRREAHHPARSHASLRILRGQHQLEDLRNRIRKDACIRRSPERKRFESRSRSGCVENTPGRICDCFLWQRRRQIPI